MHSVISRMENPYTDGDDRETLDVASEVIWSYNTDTGLS